MARNNGPIVRDDLYIQNAKLKFRNFSGKAGDYNAEGVRTFSVVLEPEDADRLKRDGWNVKELKPRSQYPDEPVQYHLPIRVNFGKYPPRIMIIDDRGKKTVDENDLPILDWMEYANVDVVVRPYNWEVSSKSGVKAYLKALYITRVEDEFEKKYRDIPDTAAGGLRDEPPWD
jgi:hypothetical protein